MAQGQLPPLDGPSIAELFEAMRNGSQEAAWIIVNAAMPVVRYEIRKQLQREGRLEPELRREYDSNDFVQAAWASLLAHPERIEMFETPEELIQFLAKVARNEVIDARRRATAAKRDVRRERAIEDLPSDAAGRLVAPGPPPCEQAAAHELWERASRDPSLLVRRVAGLLCAGKPPGAIAMELGLSARVVRRAIEEIRRRYAP